MFAAGFHFIFCLFIFSAAADNAANETGPVEIVHRAVIVGILMDNPELSYSAELVMSALSWAVKSIRELYPHIEFRTVFRNSTRKCSESFAGAFAAEEYYLREVSVFIGPGCTYALHQVGRMAAYWNIPIYTAGGIDDSFSDKEIFSTLTRLSFSLDRVSGFLIKILKQFHWRHIAVLSDESSLRDVLMSQSVERAFKIAGMHEFQKQMYHFNSLKQNGSFTRLLKSAQQKARVLILIANSETVRSILLEAHSLGMGEGDYVFLGIELIKNQNRSGDFNWYQKGGHNNQEARKMYESLMVVSVRVPTSEDYTNLVRRMTNPSSTTVNTAVNDTSVNPIIAAFYDCVLVYAWSLNKTLAEGGNPKDGYSIVRQVWNTTFTAGALTGNISINENGDREADFTLSDMDPVTGKMKPVAAYFGVRRVYENIDGSLIHWPKGSPPDDVPFCGFLGDAPHCRQLESFPVGASASLIICLLLLMGALGGFVLYRRMKFESQLSDFWWKVRWDDITFAQNIAPKSVGSVRAMEDNLNKVNAGSYSNLSTLEEAPVAGNAGIYKGIKVVVTKLPMKKFAVTRAVLMELKQMRDLTHENLVQFVGLCIENPNFAILTVLCPRGTLHDMLQNDSIKIDWVFRYSMISDIVEGLLFIHNSSIGVHGRLRSSNCVIDGRFVVKLSGYGLQSVYNQTLDEEEMNPKSLFWCAPEHLRELHPMRHGSKSGDVYSFAIILQELMTRTGPYVTFQRLSMKREQIEPEEILDRVRMSTIPPFRPEVSPECGPSDLLQLMRRCWAENPDERPTFPEIKAELKTVTKGISSKNFLDNLLNRMEQYANNLESLVEEKTRSLVEEKKKTDELLYQLLPRYVADELKRGHHVTPEAFESVTIFFSDVVGFTPLAAESTPMEVVDLLNDLYSCFDATIENHNVYKVETIGDAYMVVSGLPIRNGYDHAKEIARMSLSVREAMGKFKIRHRSDRKLQVRIGVHSGPCAAGVVGLKMPRYCLFGDTVNTASRMESNGQAMKIHVSSKTKAILDMFGTFRLTLRGDINIKGKGVMRTFWLEGEDAFDYESSPSNPTVDELLDA